MCKSKNKAKKDKNLTITYKSVDKVKDELFNNGWRNDSLSPLSTKTYWATLFNLIPIDEKVLSVIFVTNSAYAVSQKTSTYVLTDRQIYLRSIVDEVQKPPKIYAYSTIKGIRLWQDRWLSSRIYIDLYFSRWHVRKLETADPTSSIHFKNALEELKGGYEINSNPFSQVNLRELSTDLKLKSESLTKKGFSSWFKKKNKKR